MIRKASVFMEHLPRNALPTARHTEPHRSTQLCQLWEEVTPVVMPRDTWHLPTSVRLYMMLCSRWWGYSHWSYRLVEGLNMVLSRRTSSQVILSHSSETYEAACEASSIIVREHPQCRTTEDWYLKYKSTNTEHYVARVGLQKSLDAVQKKYTGTHRIPCTIARLYTEQ